jgi:hypothetical protein
MALLGSSTFADLAKVLIKRVREHRGAPRRPVLTTPLIERQSVIALALSNHKARKLKNAPSTGETLLEPS